MIGFGLEQRPGASGSGVNDCGDSAIGVLNVYSQYLLWGFFPLHVKIQFVMAQPHAWLTAGASLLITGLRLDLGWLSLNLSLVSCPSTWHLALRFLDTVPWLVSGHPLACP